MRLLLCHMGTTGTVISNHTVSPVLLQKRIWKDGRETGEYIQVVLLLQPVLLLLYSCVRMVGKNCLLGRRLPEQYLISIGIKIWTGEERFIG
jgi:hypothetical protein